MIFLVHANETYAKIDFDIYDQLPMTDANHTCARSEFGYGGEIDFG